MGVLRNLGLPQGASVGGNRIRLLVDGAQAFPAMLQAIAGAQHSVALESYIFATDVTGRRFLQALVEAAQRDVAVRVLIDGVGSMGTDPEFFAPLVAAGGEIFVYQPWRILGLSATAWRRDHRKLLVVDEAVGFLGGINIADDYAPPSEGGAGWHDMHAQVEGPAAHDLLRLMARTWRRVCKKELPLGPRVAPQGAVAVHILESRLGRRLSVRRAYLQAIRHATTRVCICNAYFIPDRGLVRALRNAARRGVTVQLLLAGTTDVQAVRYASRALYSTFLRHGVQIYEWTDRVLHAKVAVVDDTWCSIGSYNMDRRSLLHNLEANIAFSDAELGAALTAQLQQDVQSSRRIDWAGWHRRSVWQKILEQFCYFWRYLL